MKKVLTSFHLIFLYLMQASDKYENRRLGWSGTSTDHVTAIDPQCSTHIHSFEILEKLHLDLPSPTAQSPNAQPAVDDPNTATMAGTKKSKP